MAIEMQPGETTLGRWTVYHESPGARARAGKLNVTDRRIVFEAQMTAGGGALRQLQQSASGAWRANNSISVDRSEVTGIEAQKGFFSKKVLVTLANGTTYVFNRGIMSVDPIMAALQQR